MLTEIAIFAPKSRRKEATIESLIPKQATDALAERLGLDLGNKVAATIKSMKKEDMDMVQLRHEDRRIRIRLG